MIPQAERQCPPKAYFVKPPPSLQNINVDPGLGASSAENQKKRDDVAGKIEIEIWGWGPSVFDRRDGPRVGNIVSVYRLVAKTI